MIIPHIKSALACEPLGPDAWFSTAWVVDRFSLPPAIDLSRDADTGSSVLKNSTEEPLYLLGRLPVDSNRSYVSEGIPEGYEPVLRLVSGQVYYWRSGTTVSQGVKYEGSGWTPNSGGQNSSSWTVTEDGVDLDAPIEQVYRDDRPTNVVVPDAQSFEIPVFYQGELWNVTGNANYALNQEYDASQGADNLGACSDLGNASGVGEYSLPISIALGLALALVVCAVVLLKLRRK